MRGRLRQSFDLALRERHRAHLAGDRVAENRSWKLFGLIPRLLLHRRRGSGSVGRDELCSREDQFAPGEWVSLIDIARSVSVERSAKSKAISEEERRGKAAQNRVLRGQVSRARHELTGAALVPRTDATFAELQGRRPEQLVRPIGKCWILSLTKFLIWTSRNSSSASEHLLRGVPRVPADAPMNCCASVWMIANFSSYCFWPQKIWLGAMHHQQPSLS